MGVGSKGGRKGAARNAKATSSVLASSNRHSAAGTPRYSSDLDDDSFAKRKNGNSSLAKNGNKRANSPLAASTLANARMNKRLKTSSPTPPPADSVATGMNRSYSSQTFAPSGLSNSTVISGSPLNPNNINTASKAAESVNNSKKREKLIDDDNDQGDNASRRYHGAPDRDSNGEEGEISEDDDDDDVALAVGAAASARPPSSGTKIKIPLRTTPSASTPKPKAFVVADDSDDSDSHLSNRHSAHAASEGDDHEVDNEDDEDAEDEDDDDDDDDEDEEDDDDDDDQDDDLHITRVTHTSSHYGSNGLAGNENKPKQSNGGGLQRERGSDGEFIDVESASEQSDADSF